jgi:hypothetical protein
MSCYDEVRLFLLHIGFLARMKTMKVRNYQNVPFLPIISLNFLILLLFILVSLLYRDFKHNLNSVLIMDLEHITIFTL